jgi:RNA polymerase sigma-70 factor, ECF subfamily
MADAPSPSGSLTSITLLARLKANESNAWERLVRLYRPLMAYWCSQFGLRNDDADDVIQNVLSVLAVKIVEFRRDQPGDSFRGWLRAITRNQAIIHLRKQTRVPTAEGGSDAQLRLAGLPSPDDTDADAPAELDALTQRALDLVRCEFENNTWEMFVAATTSEEPAAAIAQRFGVSSAMVRQAKARILRRLRVELGEILD